MPFCNNCGTQVGEEIKFCSNCGKSMVRPAQIQKQQPQVPPAPKEDKPRYLYLILEGIGAYILCFGLFIGAILDKKQTNHIRLAMIVAAGLIIGLKLSGIMYVLFRTAYI